ncbi:MAG: UDP-N-acetylglucosamine pyrophosphorylase [Bacilli bacterium]|nr:UDP-N-acetylglucosamine pyrophosphorylase [Bacilli bacterium]
MIVKKEVETCELFKCENSHIKELFEQNYYPWEILPKINSHIIKYIETGIDGYSKLGDDILIGEDVKIYPTATIEGPAIIGSGTEIRPGAFIRANVIIGENCVIGNSTEIKNSILLDFVKAPHYNYVGDSILGNHVHMGAGAICSNLKIDGKNVVIHGDIDYETNLNKLGSVLADGVEIGSNCVLNPGTIVGKNAFIYPLTPLRGVIPRDVIVKSSNDIVERK